MIDIDKMKALAASLRDNHAREIHDWDAYLNAAAAIDTLLSELEAREADRRDAERYRWLRGNAQPSYLMMATINEGVPSLCRRELLTIDAQSWQALDQHIDAALAQRQEGEEK
jgi:hypothetical protein